MKPNRKKQRDKQLLKMQRELNLLYKEKPVSEKLKQPIQQGWRRYLVMTATALKHAQFKTFAKLLNLAHPQTSRHRHFKTIDGNTKRLIDINPFQFPTINHNVFDREQFCVLPQRLLRQCYGGPRCSCHKYLTPNPHYHVEVEEAAKYFEPKIVPNMLTHVYLVDGEKASKKQKLNNKLTNSNGWHRLTKLRGGYGFDSWRDPKTRMDIIAEESKQAQLKDLD